VNTGPNGSPFDLLAAAAVTVIGSLFAAADTALSEIPEGRLQALGSEATPRGAVFARFLKDFAKIRSRWLVGRIVALSLASALLDDAARTAGLDRLALPACALGAVLTYGTFTEALATIARRRPERTGQTALTVLRPLEWLMAPLADPLALIGQAIRRRVPKATAIDARIAETEVQWVVSEGQKTGAIANEPAEMIRKVLDFKDVRAREVMIPRRHVIGIEVSTALPDVVAVAASEKHSRYPVFRENIDNIVGLLDVKDLFAVVRDGRLAVVRLREIIHSPVLFVSENQPATQILHDMRSRGAHVAIVSDEFGGTAGLVTLRDIIEQIVGDIGRATDADSPIQSFGDGRVFADASVPLADLSSALGRPFPADGDFESLGGLIVSRTGRVPDVGATIVIDGLKLIVREADETRVVKVEIVPMRAAPAPAAV
jgi:putative hemolysin